jgi:hypothetical protein
MNSFDLYVVSVVGISSSLECQTSIMYVHFLKYLFPVSMQ